MFWRSKKAVAIDLDWIISLGLFLIYLGVFFIILRQIPTQQTPADALLESVSDGVTGLASWNVQKVPLYIRSNISGTEPIILDFPYDWKNFTFVDNMSFDIKDGKLVFAKRLNQGRNVLELANSGENYTRPNEQFDLEASSTAVSINSQKFTAQFASSLLARANHYEKERLDELNISLSGIALKPETAKAEANISALSAKYKLAYTQLNHTSFVVAEYPRIFNYISTGMKESHGVIISATIHNYTFFHINSEVSGTINYTTSKCTSSFSRYIDFYDGTTGVSFIAPQGSNISFCAAGKTARLTIRFALRNETRYDIFFHEGDFNSTLKYVSPYKAAYGATENLTGISARLYRKVNEAGYDALRASFGYPKSRDFSFSLTNESGAAIFSYQPKAPGITNIYAKESDVFILDKYGKKTKHKLRIKGW